MQVNYPTSNNFLFNQIGGISRLYQYDIGSWDMSTDNTVAVPHTLGINFLRIFSINVMIRDDLSFEVYSLSGVGQINNGGISALLDVYIGDINDTNINLYRQSPTYFSSLNFSDPGVNRGRITVWVNS